MKIKNHMKIQFISNPENVALARVAVASFAAQLDCTLNELDEIKVATSEAVSNAIIHGYSGEADGVVKISATIYEDDSLEIIIEDEGKGIRDIEEAMQPAFSTEPERMGLGFTFMQSFMHDLKVESEPGRGTKITMVKKLEPGPKQTGSGY